eukprot:scaffold1006_cov270-Pinguiococcus_pyrenoidosus.AAC.9
MTCLVVGLYLKDDCAHVLANRPGDEPGIELVLDETQVHDAASGRESSCAYRSGAGFSSLARLPLSFDLLPLIAVLDRQLIQQNASY